MKAETTLPKFDIIGPTAEDDVRRLIRHYGAKAVQAAVKLQTARRRGPIPKKDWHQLIPILQEDARLWLEGGNPFKARSNRKIALGFTSNYPEQSDNARYRRIMRKLAERRRYYTLAEAESLSQAQYPYTENLRALRELVRIGILRDQWVRLLRHIEQDLTDYRNKFGEPPASLSVQELQEESARALIPSGTPGPGNVLQILLGS